MEFVLISSISFIDLRSCREKISMVAPQEGIKFHLRYKLMYFLCYFIFFVLTLGNFGGLRFRVFGVLGS